jgi:site-specific recombinase XerD
MTNDITLAQTLDGATLDSFLLYLEDMPNTAKTYKSCIKRFKLWLKDQPDAQQPTTNTIRRYKEDLTKRGYKPNTVHLYMVAIKQWFKWLESIGKYPNIAQYVKSGKVNRKSPKSYFEAAQVKEILDQIDQTTQAGKRDYALLVLLFTCGLLTIEASRAKVKDITILGASRVLLVQGKGKVDASDYVPLPDHVYTVLTDYLTTRGIDAKDIPACTEPLFTSTSNRSKGQTLSTRSISKICKTRFIKAGFNDPKWTAHSTRHTAGILSLELGHSQRDTQLMLRHASGDTTNIYLHQIGKLGNSATADISKAIFD